MGALAIVDGRAGVIVTGRRVRATGTARVVAGAIVDGGVLIVEAGRHVHATGDFDFVTDSVGVLVVQAILIAVDIGLVVEVHREGAGAVVQRGLHVMVAGEWIRAALAALVVAGAVRDEGLGVVVARLSVRTPGATHVVALPVIQRRLRMEVAGAEVHASGHLLLVTHAVGVGIVVADTVAIHIGGRVEVSLEETGLIGSKGEGGVVVARLGVQTSVAVESAASILDVGVGVVVAGLGNRASVHQAEAIPVYAGFGHALATVGEVAGLHAVKVGVRVIVAGESKRARCTGNQVARAIIHIGTRVIIACLGRRASRVLAAKVNGGTTGVVRSRRIHAARNAHRRVEGVGRAQGELRVLLETVHLDLRVREGGSCRRQPDGRLRLDGGSVQVEFGRSQLHLARGRGRQDMQSNASRILEEGALHGELEIPRTAEGDSRTIGVEAGIRHTQRAGCLQDGGIKSGNAAVFNGHSVAGNEAPASWSVLPDEQAVAQGQS